MLVHIHTQTHARTHTHTHTHAQTYTHLGQHMGYEDAAMHLTREASYRLP